MWTEVTRALATGGPFTVPLVLVAAALGGLLMWRATATEATPVARRLATALVASAPLLGLLGTVDGMIETFEALGRQALFSSSTSIASGVSRALWTTQAGLCIAIPGHLVSRWLDRRSS